ncbi:hypothetical protein MPSEU_000946000 [Mayamaea pseudoterrestris]|nr:hypothetical protein MPSEU_000946000 [Mayamaea pseudoterrestris]
MLASCRFQAGRFGRITSPTHWQAQFHLVAASGPASSYLATSITAQQQLLQHRSLSYKIAIVGSGPSGCYTAKYLLSSLEKHGVNKHDVSIRVLERLPTPFGLVRFGVAPDHPEVKNVENDFIRMFRDEHGIIQYYGNVHVGVDVSVKELRAKHDAVVLAYGCESDQKLGIKGEDDLAGVLSARQFVAWYNGHPDFVHIGEQVERALGTEQDEKGIRQASVVVVGQGNVALDCARILAKGASGLFETDIASHALPVIGNGAKHVSIVGRRGHVQGAFTIKELRELVKLDEEGHDAFLKVRQSELDLGATDASMKELESPAGRPRKRIDKLLRDAAKKEPTSWPSKLVDLRFLLSPKEFVGNELDASELGSIVCERTILQGEPGKQVAIGTGELETLSASLALVSIGYKGVALPGTDEWFDERRGIMVNEHGLIDPPNENMGGLYASGWLKRGPSGIIGTNIVDAKDTVSTILHVLKDGQKPPLSNEDDDDLDESLRKRNVTVVDWEGVGRIFDAERHSLRSELQPREKLTSVTKQLEVALMR